MTQLSTERGTLSRCAEYRNFTAGANIFGGAMVAVNASGVAVPAAATAGLIVVGRAEHSVSSGGSIDVAAGCFNLNPNTGVSATKADIGKVAYVVDDQTVTLTSGGSGTVNISAGKVFDVDSDGIWVHIA